MADRNPRREYFDQIFSGTASNCIALNRYAAHSPLQPLLFIGAATLTLALALLSVSAHSILVAREKWVAALRYE